MSNKFKTTLKRPMLEALSSYIEMLIVKHPAQEDDDKLLYANLLEVKLKADQKLAAYKEVYSLTLCPAQAIAVRIMYVNYVIDSTTYLGNKLLQLSNQIHQQFFNIKL